jgi:hypothetical protein
MVDLTKTFEHEHGFTISEDGSETFKLVSGTAAPSGAAPTGSIYKRSNGEDWYKFIGGWGILNSSTESQSVVYSGQDIDTLTVYKTASQITANRIAQVAVTYTGKNPTQEVWTYYDPSDGTTVLQTSTLTHTFSGNNYTGTTRVDV